MAALGKVVVVSTVHKRFDTRIFVKQCRSLVRAGYSVSYLVSDGQGDALVDDVQIIDLGQSRARAWRMAFVLLKLGNILCKHNADVYHLHDPELLLVLPLLLLRGRRVVFDFHEDVPEQIRRKPYLPAFLRLPISLAFYALQKICARHLSALIGATPHITAQFSKINPLSVTIHNYPDLSEFRASPVKSQIGAVLPICYVGALSRSRGILELVQAMEYVRPNIKLLLGGEFDSPQFRARVEAEPGWNRVEYLSILSRDAVVRVYRQSIVGMVTLLPEPGYVISLPVKMFEYMAAGLPIIASNFEYWEQFVSQEGTGMSVDPTQPQEIAEAINSLTAYPEKAIEMGALGARLVRAKYTWSAEANKLIDLYSEILRDGE